jgi:hypothetical protein
MRIRVGAKVLALVVTVLCGANPDPSFSHGVMTNPSSRAVGTPNEDYQYCFDTPGCECGEFPDAGAVVVTYKPGQTIQVTIDVTQSHSAGTIFRFQLCPPDQLSHECLVAGEFATVAFDQSVGPRTYDIKLPEELECDPCVLRWKWDYGFLSCADVRIVAHDLSGERPTWTALKTTYR